VGKSVVMKHAVRTSKCQGSDDLRVSFFLHGQGTLLQKTPLGLFRALLNQLMPHYPFNLVKLTTVYRDRELRYGGYSAGRWHWDCNELREALLTALVHEKPNRRVTIFIDALDECGEKSAKQLLGYFAKLMSQVEETGALVKICLSSRHYPVLGLDRFPTISVEEENSDDIRSYVNERLRDFQPYMKGAELLDQILTKARGTFQWVFLVIEKMRTTILIGGRTETLLNDLATCPESLNEMYAALLQSETGSEEHHMMSLFQWVMFSERPLSAQELREALAADTAKDYKSIKELRSQECWSDTLEAFERHVKHVSRGLVHFHNREVWEQHEPGGEDWNREAQFIHQSVADFLLVTHLHGIEPIETGTANSQISRSCLRYISLDEVLAGCQLQRGALSTRFPLAPYATRYIFTHIDAAEKACIDQLDLLSIIGKLITSATAPKISKLWGTLNPHNIGTPVGWPFTSSSELHILAGLGTTSTLSAFLDAEDRVMDTKDIHGNSPLHVALAAGHQQSAMIVLDHLLEQSKRRCNTIVCKTNATNLAEPGRTWCADLSARNDEGETILDIAIAMQAHMVVTRLVEVKANIHCMDQSDSFLRYAMSNNDMTILSKLIEENCDLSGAVYFAVKTNLSDEIIVKLLKAGADHEAKAPVNIDNETGADNSDEAASHSDARSRRLYEFEISANAGTDMDRFSSHEAGSQDGDSADQAGGNALHLACRRALSSKVNLLLSHGVSATSRDNMLRCPLHVIVDQDFEYDEQYEDSYDITRSLLSYAPEAVEFKDINGDTPLSVAANNYRPDQARDMLESGYYKNPSPALTNFFLRPDYYHLRALLSDDLVLSAVRGHIGKLDLKQVNSDGQTIFWRAAARGVRELVALLLEKCIVDVNIRDKNLTTPLLAAVKQGCYAVVDILLEAKDIDVNAQDNEGLSPLLAAVKGSNRAMAKLLLANNTVNVNTQDNKGLSPLLAAVKRTDADIVEILLANNTININTQDNEGLSPLLAAVKGSDPAMVKSLLANNTVNVNTQDNKGLSPLLAAVKRTDADILKILLANTIGVNIKDQNGMSLLLCATTTGYCSECSTIIDRLLAAEDVDISDATSAALRLYDTKRRSEKGGASMLCTAIRMGDTRLAHLLVGRCGFDVNVNDGEGYSPVRIAAEQADKTIFNFLVARRETDLDIEDACGQSLLSWAAEVGIVTVVMVLLGTGRVSLHHTDHSGLTPLQKAQRNGHWVIATILQAQLDATILRARNLPRQQYVIRQPQPPPGQPDRW
jgi:ankyrin repeat protein